MSCSNIQNESFMDRISNITISLTLLLFQHGISSWPRSTAIAASQLLSEEVEKLFQTPIPRKMKMNKELPAEEVKRLPIRIFIQSGV